MTGTYMYIVALAVNFIGGGNRNTGTMRKPQPAACH